MKKIISYLLSVFAVVSFSAGLNAEKLYFLKANGVLGNTYVVNKPLWVHLRKNGNLLGCTQVYSSAKR